MARPGLGTFRHRRPGLITQLGGIVRTLATGAVGTVTRQPVNRGARSGKGLVQTFTTAVDNGERGEQCQRRVWWTPGRGRVRRPPGRLHLEHAPVEREGQGRPRQRSAPPEWTCTTRGDLLAVEVGGMDCHSSSSSATPMSLHRRGRGAPGRSRRGAWPSGSAPCTPRSARPRRTSRCKGRRG
jgi:hypothetical protein